MHLEEHSVDVFTGSPRGSLDDQKAILEMTEEVMSRLDESSFFVDKVSEPVL
jgi:hypothetical protein